MRLTGSFFHFIFVWTITEKEYTLCMKPFTFELATRLSTPLLNSSSKPTNIESPVTDIPVTVRNWISKSPQNDAKEIIRIFENILRKEHRNRKKIELSLLEEIAEFNLSPMTSFSQIRMKYKWKSEYAYSIFNEYTCSSDYIQVTISTLLDELQIHGFVNTLVNNFTHNIEFSVSLGNTLIKNERFFPVAASNKTSEMYKGHSETNIQYESMKPYIEANNELAPTILPWLSDVITHVKPYLHEFIDKALSEKINSDLTIFDEFEYSINRMDIVVTTLNKDYIINDEHTEKSETHSISVGPAVLRGFSNVTKIKWQFGWADSYEFYQKTVVDVGPLYACADWSIISSKKNYFNSTNDFYVRNIQLIGLHDRNIDRYFEVNVETSVTEQSQINLAVNNVIADNLNKLISKDVENSLKN